MFKNTKKPPPSNINHKDVTHGAKDFDVLKTPIKSFSDKKEYKVIRLKNGLTACIISDITNIDSKPADPYDSSDSEFETESEYESESQTSASEPEVADHDDSKMKKVSTSEQKMAAAALSIGVGSFSDPPDIPGLAHFLEHMVFMGSEKYPQENDFDSFIKKKGGSDNASTDCEITTFYFECLEKHLHRSLDKFAQFFISPLMKKETMTREREAIESEFQMALPSDTYRKEQLLLSLFNSDVAINSFGWGNLKTLRDNITDDVLYQRLHEFRKYHYSGHRMTLAIQARLPINVLESFVVECFSNVPCNNLPADDFTKYSDHIFDSPNFKKIYYVEPVKEVIQVDITWPLPSLLHMYKSKPHQYVSWLIGHEGKGSLLSFLKKKVWALGIFSGNDESGSDHNSIYSLFTITIVLTKDGLKNLDEVIAAVYSYLRLLNEMGPQERIFKEIQLVEDTSFKFTEEEDPIDFVEELAECMQVYPSEYYLAGGELYFEYDPKAIEMVMSHLRVDKMNIMVLTSSLPHDLDYDQLEPWFSINYAAKDVPDAWKEKWSNVSVYPDFALPSENPYLTNDFSILPDHPYLSKYPEKVFKNDTLELWFKQDNKFKFPIGYYHFYFITPLIAQSAINACLTDMFINLLGVQLTEEIYPATAAELNYAISVGDKGIIIKVDGYNEKLPTLLNLILTYFKKVSENLTVAIFEAVKDKLTKVYHNKFLKPFDLAKDIRLSILLNHYWTAVDKHAAMFKLTYDMMKSFSDELVKSFYILGLIQGNVNKETAIKTSKMLLDIVNCKPLLPEKFPKVQVRELPNGEYCCRTMSFNENDSNSIIVNYYQSERFTMRINVILELLMMYIEEPLFDILRTKEQLGYHVYCTVRDTFGILGYSITVNAQAGKSTTYFVDSRIEAFIKQMNKQLKKLTEKKFNQIKRDLIKIKRCGDVDLEEEVGRNWGEIVNQDFIFDREEKEAYAIEEIKVADIRRFWEDHNTVSSKKLFKKLTVQVVGHNVDERSQEKNEGSGKINVKMSPRVMRKIRGPNTEIEVSKLQASAKHEHTLKLIGILNNSEGKNEDYYITNIKEFTKDLPLHPVITRGDLLL
ncbi:hypothetical protein Trydic_g17927 [Trypoxylus dichotomus]